MSYLFTFLLFTALGYLLRVIIEDERHNTRLFHFRTHGTGSRLTDNPEER